MVHDLTSRYRLVGMTEDEIIRLLGRDEPTDYFKEYDFVYWLGPEPGPFGVDSEWLVLRLGSDHHVIEAKVVTD